MTEEYRIEDAIRVRLQELEEDMIEKHAAETELQARKYAAEAELQAQKHAAEMLAFARAFIRKGTPVNEVADILGLTPEQILAEPAEEDEPTKV